MTEISKKNTETLWDPVFIEFIKRKEELKASTLVGCVGGEAFTLYPPYTINEQSIYLVAIGHYQTTNQKIVNINSIAHMS